MKLEGQEGWGWGQVELLGVGAGGAIVDTPCPPLTPPQSQRLIGFGCCFAFGVLLTLISIPMLWTMQITKFAVMYR